MIEYKQNVTATIPVRIVDSSGNPVTGIGYGSVTATAIDSTGFVWDITPPSFADWTEITTDAFFGQGFYLLSVVGAGALSVPGLLTYAVTDGVNKVYMGAVKVVANEEVDTYTRVGAPVGASISADIAGVPDTVWDESLAGHVAAGSAGEALGGLDSGITTLIKHAEGRWKIDTGTNQLTIYDTDDTTPLIVFDLKDPAGAATSTLVFERVKV